MHPGRSINSVSQAVSFMSELDMLVKARHRGNKKISGNTSRTMLEIMVEILGHCSEPVTKSKLDHLIQASSVLMEKYLRSLLKANLVTVSEGGMFCITERGRAIHTILAA